MFKHLLWLKLSHILLKRITHGLERVNVGALGAHILNKKLLKGPLHAESPSGLGINRERCKIKVDSNRHVEPAGFTLLQRHMLCL